MNGSWNESLMGLSLGGIIRRWWKLGNRTCWGAVDGQGCVLEYTLSLAHAFSFLPDCCEVSHSHHVFVPHDRPRKHGAKWLNWDLSTPEPPYSFLLYCSLPRYLSQRWGPAQLPLSINSRSTVHWAFIRHLLNAWLLTRFWGFSRRQDNNGSYAQIDCIVSHRTNHLVPKLTTNGYT